MSNFCTTSRLPARHGRRKAKHIAGDRYPVKATPTFDTAADGCSLNAQVPRQSSPTKVLTRRRPAILRGGLGYEVGHKGRGLELDGLIDWREVETLLVESYRLLAPRDLAAKLDAT